MDEIIERIKEDLANTDEEKVWTWSEVSYLVSVINKLEARDIKAAEAVRRVNDGL